MNRVGIALSALLISPVVADDVPWSNPSGSTARFSWSNGRSETGRFGSPIVVDDQWVFFPQNFRAQSVGGGFARVDDRMFVDLIAAPGYRFSRFSVAFEGDFGVGGDGGSVREAGAIEVLDLLSDRRERAESQFETDALQPGRWSDQISVDLTHSTRDWLQVSFSLEMGLSAFSVPGAVAFIEQRVFHGIAIEMASASACPADFNADGFLDFFDYGDYVDCFEQGACPEGRTADFNGDDFVDFFDYDAFVSAFQAGC